MRCERVKELLVEFEDAALPADVAGHMDQCPSCRQHHRQMLAVRRLLSLKKHERRDPQREERTALSIRRTLEDLNRKPESGLTPFWNFLTDTPRPALRYALAAAVAILVVINWVSMPQLVPIRPAASIAYQPAPAPKNPEPAPVLAPVPVYQQPVFANLQPPSNRGPARVEYGPRESVPANFDY